MGFRPDRIVLDEMPWNSEQSFLLAFVNESGDEITVSDLTTSCNCTLVDRDEYVGRVLRPWETVDIVGSFEAGERAGVSRQRVTLVTRSGYTHSAVVEAKVHGTYQVLPHILEFREVDTGSVDSEPVAQSIVFRSDTARIVGQADIDSLWLRLVESETVEADTVMHVVVIPQLLPLGANVARAVVPTDDPYRPEFSVFVNAEGVALLRAVPSQVFLRPGESKTVRFIDHDGDMVDVTRLEGTVNGISARIVESGDAVVLMRSVESNNARAGTVWVTDANGRRARVLVTAYD